MRRRLLVASEAFFGAALAASGAPAQQPIELVSINTDGTGNGGADPYANNPMSRDGRWVVFSSVSSTLVAGDVNGNDDVFVRDRQTGINLLMSVASDGTQGNDASFLPAISGDGRFVAFSSAADNLVAGDTNRYRDVFLHDRDPDGNGIFDEGNATTILISRRTDGGQSDDVSTDPVISGDGSTVVFESGSNLTPDSDGTIQLFAYDVASGTLTCVSVGYDGDPSGGDSRHASLSDDGRLVAFESRSGRLVQDDSNGRMDVFVRDRQAGVTTRVSVATDGTQGDDDSYDAAISADGSLVAFASDARNLVPGDLNGNADVFLHDPVAGTTELASILSDGTQAAGASRHPVLSGDGGLLAFDTLANNLVPLDPNGKSDVVLRDRSTGTFETISANCMGGTANGPSSLPALTPDGRFVSLFSDATNLNDGGFAGDLIYLRDRTVSWPMASAANYGAGWPGTLGVPSLTADPVPSYGATVDVDLGNSYGFWTVAFLLVGLTQDSIQTSKDGTLLLDILRPIPFAVGPDGLELSTTIPYDESLCGFEIDLQALELDPGASKGISFTEGLQLLIGR
jgi:Tol biopolymer transport system component